MIPSARKTNEDDVPTACWPVFILGQESTTCSLVTDPVIPIGTKRFFPHVHVAELPSREKAVQGLWSILRKHLEAHSILDVALNVETWAKKSVEAEILLNRTPSWHRVLLQRLIRIKRKIMGSFNFLIFLSSKGNKCNYNFCLEHGLKGTIHLVSEFHILFSDCLSKNNSTRTFIVLNLWPFKTAYLCKKSLLEA